MRHERAIELATTAMDRPWQMAFFKLIAFALLLVNVTMHGTVALFVGGPLGLVLYLVGFTLLWAGGWFALRRFHAAES